MYRLTLKQGCPNSVLEDHCHAEFSSNWPQRTCLKVSSPSCRILMSRIRCFDLGWRQTLQECCPLGPKEPHSSSKFMAKDNIIWL